MLARTLSGLLVQLEGARLVAEQEGSPELAGTLEQAHRLARSGLQETRRAIGMLRDEQLPGPESLPALVRDFERDTGVPCRLAVSGTPRPYGPQARLALYRVAQEALTNVRRHAAAQRVELALDHAPDGARLTVQDVGAPADAARCRLRAARDEGAGRTARRHVRRGGGRRRVAGRAVGAPVIRVVVADDQRVVRKGMAMLLGRLPGIEVVGSAVDGEDAVALAGRAAPDVVLMDLRMPRCDGVERYTGSGTSGTRRRWSR